MTTTSVYPVLMSEDVPAAAEFYCQHFGFTPAFESDWYVSLRLEGFELALLHHSHETVPSGYRGRSAGGVLLNIEVDDVDAVYQRLVVDGSLSPTLALRSEAFGQRHFIITGPDNVLIDVITPIEPSETFAAQFT